MLNNQRVIVRWHVVFESRINPHYRHFESLDQLIKINNGIKGVLNTDNNNMMNNPHTHTHTHVSGEMKSERLSMMK